MLPDHIFAALQHFIPQHLLSRAIGVLAESRFGPLKNFAIRKFAEKFDVDLSEAKISDYRQFENFNAFFTRELKDGARDIVGSKNAIACPADGCISEIGDIQLGSIMQAKGKNYTLSALLAGDEALCQSLTGGKFATVYLSPKDYHRVHMPIDGKLVKMTYVPGKLFSVNQATADNIANLFARNERLICHFESVQGPFVVVLVGAMIVAGIETVWAGQIAPFKKKVSTTHYRQVEDIDLKKGEEMGRFKLGSTAIMLFPEKTVAWDENLKAGSPVRMGEFMGTIT